jgi:hypothetical protein
MAFEAGFAQCLHYPQWDIECLDVSFPSYGNNPLFSVSHGVNSKSLVLVFVQKSAVDVGRTWIVVVLYCLEKDWSHMFLAWFCTKRFAVPFDFIFRKKVVCCLSMWQWHFHLEWGSEDTRTEMKYGFYCWLIAYNIYKMRGSYSTNLVVSV